MYFFNLKIEIGWDGMGGRTWYEGRVAIDAGWKGERCTPKHDGDRFIESHYLKSYESNLRKLCERLWVVGREGGSIGNGECLDIFDNENSKIVSRITNSNNGTEREIEREGNRVEF